MHRLIGIAFSHYVEKARWVLERYEVDYRDERYLPMLHMPAAAWASRGRGRADPISSPYSTPILITDDGRRICDSVAIVGYASERWGGGELHQDDEAAVLEQHFHDRLGPDTRRVGYFFSLDNRAAMKTLLGNVGPAQRSLGRLMLPITAPALKRALRITNERVERAIARTKAELDAVGARMADGRPYLLGDRFSAADLAFACAIAPALLVQPDEGYSAALPTREQLAAPARALVDEVRDTPAARFALRLFREERTRPPAGA